jgi:hypothetical protein
MSAAVLLHDARISPSPQGSKKSLLLGIANSQSDRNTRESNIAHKSNNQSFLLWGVRHE